MLRENYNKKYFENILLKNKNGSKRTAKRKSEILNVCKHGNLLEVGCGKGFLLKELETTHNVKGLEISKYAADKANLLLDRVVVNNVDIEKINIEKSKYKIIIAYNILEHLANPENSLKSLFDGLQKEGILIGSVPNNQHLIGHLFTKYTNFIDKTHISTLQISKWRSLFKNVGFNIISEYGEVPLTVNNCVYIKSPVWQYLAFNYIFVLTK